VDTKDENKGGIRLGFFTEKLINTYEFVNLMIDYKLSILLIDDKHYD
jgi:hypothetical protein